MVELRHAAVVYFLSFNAGQLLEVQKLDSKHCFSLGLGSLGPSWVFQLFLIKKNKIMWRTENSEKCIEMLLSFGKVNASKQRRHVNQHLLLWTGRQAVRSYNSRAQLSSCDLCGDAHACGPCDSVASASLSHPNACLLVCFMLLFSLQCWLWFIFLKTPPNTFISRSHMWLSCFHKQILPLLWKLMFFFLWDGMGVYNWSLYV